MRLFKFVFLLWMAIFYSACQKAPENQLIVFMEREEGVEPYQTRIIVTPTHVRFDDGEGANAYLLFDRKTRTARNVDVEKKTVMELHTKSIKIEPPFALNHAVKDLGEMKDAPTIMGKLPRHYQELTNDQVCFDVITIEGLMPQAVQALTEFHLLLASDSMTTFNEIPADMHEPCEMAMSTFAPTRYLQHGFPIQQWRGGYSRMLVDYKEHYQAEPGLFAIPEGYFHYSLQQLRDGLVDFEKREIIVNPAAKTN